MGLEAGKESELMDEFSKTVQIDLKLDSLEQKRRKRVYVRKRTLNTPHDKSTKTETADLRYEELLQSIYDSVVITDTAGGIMKANQRTSRYFGFTLNELHQMNVTDLIVGSDSGLFEHFSSESSSDYLLIEAHCCRRDQSLFPAEITANRLRIPTERLCFFIRNMERRNATELHLRTIRNAVNNSPTGIVVTDVSGAIHYVNPAMVEMWRLGSVEAMIGKYVGDLCEETDIISSMMTILKDERDTWTGELLATPSSGPSFPVQMSTAPNANADNELVGFVFSFMNISDRKKAEEAIRQAEKDEAMLASLAGACHHLSQPATVLMTNAALMKKQCVDCSNDLQELIDSYSLAADELQHILRSLNSLHHFSSTRYLAKHSGLSEFENAILDLPESVVQP